MFDPLPYVAPLFVLGLVVEGRAVRYSTRSLGSGLGCVAVDQLTAAWGLLLFVSAYDATHEAIGLFESSPGRVGSWVIAIVAHDLAYYAFHRASHRVNVLWAAHVVHHHGETYDFTVSLRQGSIATWVSYVFYWPVALLVDAQTFLIVHAAYQVHQFFVHTRLVRRLGPLEWIFATPSHHRVHHGSERAHVDRNYGGFFIVFDRLFGTFTPETREPVYGVPGGYDVARPLFANTYMILRLLRASAKETTVRGWLRLWLGPPEASAHRLSAAARVPRARVRSRGRRVFVPLVAGLFGAVVFVFLRGSLPIGWTVLVGLTSIAAIELGCARLEG